MASNFNGKELLNSPKSNETNIIGLICNNCGHKNHIMITGVNVSNNYIDSRQHFNISCDENGFESNDSFENLNEEMSEKLKISNNGRADEEKDKTPALNEILNRKSDEISSQSTSRNTSEVMNGFPVMRNTPFNETQLKNNLKKLIRVPPNSHDGNTIGKYFLNSQKIPNDSKTENNSNKVEITNVFSPYKKGKEPKIDRSCASDRRLMLWFGIKKEVLSQMLDNRVFETPIIMGKLGNGYYFSDRVSESVKYCDQKNGFLLLCEVSVGKMFRIGKVKQFSSSPHGFDSIKFIGKYMADKQPVEKYNNDVIVPIGKTVQNPNVSQSEFHFNRYVVFDQKRIQIRFIVEFESE